MTTELDRLIEGKNSMNIPGGEIIAKVLVLILGIVAIVVVLRWLWGTIFGGFDPGNIAESLTGLFKKGGSSLKTGFSDIADTLKNIKHFPGIKSDDWNPNHLKANFKGIFKNKTPTLYHTFSVDDEKFNMSKESLSSIAEVVKHHAEHDTHINFDGDNRIPDREKAKNLYDKSTKSTAHMVKQLKSCFP